MKYSFEPRNVRLGLATEGFNPFENMNINYSTWPVILMIYNLPLGLCMQRSYMMMSLLIEGPTGPKQHRHLLAAINRGVEYIVGSKDINFVGRLEGVNK